MRQVRKQVLDGVWDDVCRVMMSVIVDKVREEIQKTVNSFSPVAIAPHWYLALNDRGRPVHDFVLQRLFEEMT